MAEPMIDSELKSMWDAAPQSAHDCLESASLANRLRCQATQPEARQMLSRVSLQLVAPRLRRGDTAEVQTPMTYGTDYMVVYNPQGKVPLRVRREGFTMDSIWPSEAEAQTRIERLADPANWKVVPVVRYPSR